MNTYYYPWGYWGDKIETIRYFRNGKLRTGDLATVDLDGFIYIVERERDIIKSGGNRVSGKEVEEMIAALKEIVEAAVVGAPHDWLGEAIEAVVVASPEASVSPTSVLAQCRKHLPPYKVPRSITFVRSLPHNSAGKKDLSAGERLAAFQQFWLLDYELQFRSRKKMGLLFVPRHCARPSDQALVYSSFVRRSAAR